MKVKNKISLILALALAFSLITPALASPPKVVCAANGRSPFSDVPDGQWYTENITVAYEDGVMTGTYQDPNTGKREFSPFSPLTMAEWTVMMVRAWYADELANSNVGYITWFNREAAILQSHGVYNGIGTNNDITFYASASRNQMAVTIANLMKDKGFSVSASDIASAKAKIPDLSSIPAGYQDSVAACYHLGILTGKSGGNFCGNDSMQRCEAATVYVRVKNVLNGKQAGDVNDPTLPINPLPTPSTPVDPTPSTPVDPNPTPSTPVNGSPVGTISSERVTINKNSIVTHAPITDYWSQQPMEIRNISDRDSFNAACQTIKDSEMILTQGQITSAGLNPYYNYAVVAPISAKTQKNVDGAMGALSGFGGTYSSYGSSYVFYKLTPYNANLHAVLDPILAQIDLTGDDRSIAEACVRIVCDRLDYEVNGGGSWLNNKPTGDCTSYSSMLHQILAVAGIPNILMTGTVAAGGHGWVICRLDGEWVVMDGVATDTGYGAIFTYAEHESMFGYSHSINDGDPQKVARALIDAAYPG